MDAQEEENVRNGEKPISTPMVEKVKISTGISCKFFSVMEEDLN